MSGLSPQSTAGPWPRYMQRATALRYCDMSESTFNENMKRGAIPQPLQMPTGVLLWDREDIDAALQAYKRVAPDNSGVRDARQAQLEARQAQIERRRAAS